MQTSPFIPDADYCVYCHAPAAGPCADCAALCCGDCVEIVMRFTSRRAVCRQCIADSPQRRRMPRWIAPLVGVAVVAALLTILW